MLQTTTQFSPLPLNIRISSYVRVFTKYFLM